MVSSLSIVLMALCAFLGVAVPIALAWWLVRKHKARWSVILVGAAAFFIAALVLESAVHQLVLNGPGGNAILGNTLFYALYGGLMAGLFEETARFLVMKYYLKNPALLEQILSAVKKAVSLPVSVKIRPQNIKIFVEHRHHYFPPLLPRRLRRAASRSRLRLHA